MKIPNTWPEYNVRKRFIYDGTVLIEFGFLVKDQKSLIKDEYAYICGIWVFKKEQFNIYSFPGDIKPPVIVKNQKYVFTEAHGQEAPAILAEQMNNRGKVYSTFRFNKQD